MSTTAVERDTALQVTCRMCNKTHEVMVAFEDALEYMNDNRRKVQHIFPYLTPEERELLISHICPECWNKMFPTEEEE